jgi:hypothetical protein
LGAGKNKSEYTYPMNSPAPSCNPGEIGPQFPKDPPFVARMRFHQSWYRARVLNAPCGSGPRPSNRTIYGNMLTRGDGDRGLNFVAKHILTVARRRMAEKKGLVDSFRLLCNLLSNQAMAFNMFGLQVDDRELAALLLPKLLPGEMRRVKQFQLLWSPTKPHELLNDPVGYDVLVEYEDQHDNLCFLGIETRLAEPSTGISTRRPEAVRWLDGPESPWIPAAWDELLDPQLSPLFRGHLLAEALLRRPDSKYVSGRFLLLYHGDDADTAQALRRYHNLLKSQPGSFQAVTLQEISAHWMASAGEQAPWLDGFCRRYLDLSSSESEWQSHG